MYSKTPLGRPPLLHQKSGLSRGVASRQGGLSKGVPLYTYLTSGLDLFKLSTMDLLGKPCNLLVGWLCLT